MKLVSAAVDHQQTAADPKDRISGCPSALAGSLWEEKRAFEFPIPLSGIRDWEADAGQLTTEERAVGEALLNRLLSDQTAKSA